MSSILTNAGAMVALQTLKATNASLAKAQDEIATGKTVSTAKDNASLWAISKVIEAEVSGFKAISSSMSVGAAAVATARNGAEKITDLLKEVRNAIVSAHSPSADHTKIQDDINQLLQQVDTIAQDAQFGGLNLLNGDVEDIQILASINRQTDGTSTPSYIEVSSQNLSLTGGGNEDLYDIDVTEVDSLAEALVKIETLLDNAIDASAAFGVAGKRISIQIDFLSNLTDSLSTGIGAMVDADMEAASARLQALQTQQQLGIQALTIANQAPQNILALFRG